MEHCNVEDLLSASYDTLPAVLFVKDTECRYIYCSKAESIFDLGPEGTVIGKTDLEVHRDRELGKQYYQQDLEILATGMPHSCISQFWDGERRVYREISRRPVYDDSSKITGVSGIITDVTELMELREKFQHLSLHDSLTGVYNRNYVVEYDFDSEENLPCSYILCDCNDLKKVNDSTGHEAGDRYIQEISNAISSAIEDNGIVIRWGGDEFLTIVPRCDETQCRHYVERINRNQEALKRRLPYASGALGWVTRTRMSQPEHRMIELADQRMYLDKQARKACVALSH